MLQSYRTSPRHIYFDLLYEFREDPAIVEISVQSMEINKLLNSDQP